MSPIQRPFDREAARQVVEEIKKMRKGLHIDDATINSPQPPSMPVQLCFPRADTALFDFFL